MGAMVKPGATSQPVQALQRANWVRRARSELKAQIAGGRLVAAEVILTCPSEVAHMAVAQLLAVSAAGARPAAARSASAPPWEKTSRSDRLPSASATRSQRY